MAIVFKAREAIIKVEDTITIDTSGPIDADFASSAEVVVKNITVTPPDGAVDKIDCIGETSNFQNQYLDIKSVGMAKCTGTLIMDGDESTFFNESFGATGTTVTGGYKRWQFGRSDTGNKRLGTSAMLVNLDNGTKEMSCVLNNGYFTKWGDLKPTGADGHWEVDFEFTCLASNFYTEFKD